MSAIKILKEMLLGNFYSRVSIGHTVDLCFHDFWLISHNVVSAEDETFKELFSGFKIIADAIDKEYIPTGTVLLATQRKLVTDVTLDLDSSLNLLFENGVSLKFTTDTDIVDWQWALNKNALDPYREFIIAVFDAGEVQISNS